MSLHLNRPCEAADPAKPDPMAMLAMEHCLAPESRQFALVAGGGTESTAFHLTNFFRWVFATDASLSAAAARSQDAPFRPQRLVIQPMDARALRHETETFDFICWNVIAAAEASIEIQYAAREMARVLKPGGVLAVSVEGGSRKELLEWIVDPSGCDPVDEPAPDAAKQTTPAHYHLTLRKPRVVKSTFASSPVHVTWHRMQDEIIQQAPAYPSERFSGKGIVICAGGPRLFTCAWVLIRMLRQVIGCKLPIKVWYLGAAEMDPRMIALLQGQGVETINAFQSERRSPAQVASGWALKPFAILNSSFREVILLDADNVALVDPAVLLDTAEYAGTGAIFWPDVARLPADCAIWDICRVAYRDEPAFESGQIVVDKQRCWKALLLAMHMNEHADFYYRHLYGDKDTFHMAFRMLEQPYSMPPMPPQMLLPEQKNTFFEYRGPVLGQHDFEGRLIFQHRNCPKWILLGENPRYTGFQRQEECLHFVSELAGLWDGKVSTLSLSPPEGYDNGGSGGRWFRYRRVSSDERLMEFLPDERIGYGAGGAEKRWRLVKKGRKRVLEIWGEKTITCRLEKGVDGMWRGNWLLFERMPVELAPLKPGEEIEGAGWKSRWARLFGTGRRRMAESAPGDS